MATIHILRHGQSFHNVERGYPHRDPPLTALGTKQAFELEILFKPDLILISPMTRTIETALLVFKDVTEQTEIQIWPDLRETSDKTCNKGLGREELSSKFPFLDFSSCPLEWDHEPHTPENATRRAANVRRKLKALSDSKNYSNIFVLTHRGFIAYLTQGERFAVCECRSFRFGTQDMAQEARFAINKDNGEQQDFGLDLLLPLGSMGLARPV